MIPRAELDEARVRTLFALFERHYAEVSLEAFRSDLAEKDWVILLSDKEGTIRGFTTLRVIDLPDEGVRAAFSGDTIIDPEYWGEQELVRLWVRFMGWLKRERPDQRLFWFLLSKGYRTYLFLPIYFLEFFPRHDAPTPEREQRLLNLLASRKFGADFDPATGVIAFAESRGHLRADLADVAPHRENDPHVRFFLEKNPRYREGTELVCLAELTPTNLKPVAKKLLLDGLEGRWTP